MKKGDKVRVMRQRNTVGVKLPVGTVTTVHSDPSGGLVALNIPGELEAGRYSYTTYPTRYLVHVPLTTHEYLYMGGSVCPWCLSGNVEGYVNVESVVTGECACLDCGAEWDDMYNIVAYALTVEGQINNKVQEGE